MDELERYRKMYAILCAAASEAIDLMTALETARACALLQEALREAEELYIADPPGQVIPFRPAGKP